MQNGPHLSLVKPARWGPERLLSITYRHIWDSESIPNKLEGAGRPA